jgi:hypothetical protein
VEEVAAAGEMTGAAVVACDEDAAAVGGDDVCDDGGRRQWIQMQRRPMVRRCFVVPAAADREKDYTAKTCRSCLCPVRSPYLRKTNNKRNISLVFRKT